MDVGLLLLRLAVGGALVLQGSQKASRAGRAGARDYLHSVGFRPAAVLAPLTAAVELGAGLLLLAGAATPLAAAGAVGVLVNAVAVNKANGWPASSGGAEYPVTLGLAAAAIAWTGSGGLGVDALLGWDEPGAAVSAGALALAAASSVPMLVRRTRALRADADLVLAA